MWAKSRVAVRGEIITLAAGPVVVNASAGGNISTSSESVGNHSSIKFGGHDAKDQCAESTDAQQKALLAQLELDWCGSQCGKRSPLAG